MFIYCSQILVGLAQDLLQDPASQAYIDVEDIFDFLTTTCRTT